MNLHFKELGQPHAAAPPLVMLHGLFGSSDNWLGVAPKLAQNARVFLVDLRNHGLSPHSDDMTFALMADDIAEFLDARQLNRARVLGHSLGGKVAMQFALTFPARLDRLVVVDIAPRAYAPEHESLFKALLALDLKQYHSRTQIEESLAPAIPDLTLRRFLLKNLKSSSSSSSSMRSFDWRIPLNSLFASYPKLCEALTFPNTFPGPMLFLRGGQSPYVSDADAPLIHQFFPQAAIETIPTARHWVHADAPDEFVKRVSDFFWPVTA